MCRNRTTVMTALAMSLLLALCPNGALAQKTALAQQAAKDKPGIGSIEEKKTDAVSSAAGNLKNIECHIEQSSTFVTDSLTSLLIQVQFTTLYGRVDLIPSKGSRNESVRFFLHGQKSESAKIQPGEYTAHFAFWLPEESLASAYPLTTEFKVSKGQIVTMGFTRAHYESIRQWLIAISTERRERLHKKRMATEKSIEIQK